MHFYSLIYYFVLFPIPRYSKKHLGGIHKLNTETVGRCVEQEGGARGRYPADDPASCAATGSALSSMSQMYWWWKQSCCKRQEHGGSRGSTGLGTLRRCAASGTEGGGCPLGHTPDGIRSSGKRDWLHSTTALGSRRTPGGSQAVFVGLGRKAVMPQVHLFTSMN